MMHQVEAMANRMLMVDQGRKVLYGPVNEIRRQYAAHALYIGGEGDWTRLSFAEQVTFDQDEQANLVYLRQGITPDDAFRLIAQQPGLHVNRFEVALPSLDDIFIEVVEGKRRSGSNGVNGKEGRS
jgi:ABC-2 type transport system ATP-binding protein